MQIEEQKHRIDVRNSDLSGSSFDHSTLSGCRFHDINLSGARIHMANLAGVSITGSRMQGFTIDGVAVEDMLALWTETQGASDEKQVQDKSE